MEVTPDAPANLHSPSTAQAVERQVTNRQGRGSQSTRQAIKWVGLAGMSAGLVAMLVQLAAFRVLALEPLQADFQVWWSAMFVMFGLLTGLQNETVRSTTRANDVGGTGPRASRVAPVVVGLVVVLGIATLPLWSQGLGAASGTQPFWLAGALLYGVAFTAFTVVVLGAAAGSRAWRLVALATGADAGTRLVLVGVVYLTGGGIEQFAWASVLSTTVIVFFLAFSRTVRRTLTTRMDAPGRVYLARVLTSMLALGAYSLLVVGFPLLLSLTTEQAELKTAAAFMLAISLTRAPFLVPLNALQGVAISYFTTSRSRGPTAGLKLVGGVMGCGVAVGALAFAVGPWLMQLLAGQSVSRLVLALLTLGGATIAVLTLTGVMCQSSGLYRFFLGGWLLAVAVSVALLLLPLPVTVKGIIALLAGPLVGASLHLFGILKHTRLAAK